MAIQRQRTVGSVKRKGKTMAPKRNCKACAKGTLVTVGAVPNTEPVQLELQCSNCGTITCEVEAVAPTLLLPGTALYTTDPAVPVLPIEEQVEKLFADRTEGKVTPLVAPTPPKKKPAAKKKAPKAKKK